MVYINCDPWRCWGTLLSIEGTTALVEIGTRIVPIPLACLEESCYL